MKTRKRDYEKCTKKSISLPIMMFDQASDLMRVLGYTKFSDLVQALIREKTRPNTFSVQ